MSKHCPILILTNVIGRTFGTGIIKAAKNNMRYLVPVIRTMTKIVSEAQEAEREREIARANLAYMADGGITAWMN